MALRYRDKSLEGRSILIKSSEFNSKALAAQQ